MASFLRLHRITAPIVHLVFAVPHGKAQHTSMEYGLPSCN